MGLLDRFRRPRGGSAGRRALGRSGGSGAARASDAEDQRHLAEFIATRRGVEGFVEPRTTVTDTTLLLVAHDGEWTRRRVPSVAWAHDFANRQGVPSYDAGLVGVPDRMRAWNHAQRQREKELLRRQLDD